MIFFNILEHYPSNAEKVRILNNWIVKLSLNTSKIKIFGSNSEYHQDGLTTFSAYTSWDNNECCWQVNIFKNSCEKTLIHELGHISFEEKIKYHTIEGNLYSTIFQLCNFIIDCFVDNELCSFEEYYSLFKNVRFNDLDKFLHIIEKFPEQNLIDFGFYIQYYISFKYIINESDRDEKSEAINKFLKGCEIILSNKYSDNKINFKGLNQLLDNFEQTKNSKNLNEIKKFHLKLIIFSSNFDKVAGNDKSFIKNQLDKIFYQ